MNKPTPKYRPHCDQIRMAHCHAGGVRSPCIVVVDWQGNPHHFSGIADSDDHIFKAIKFAASLYPKKPHRPHYETPHREPPAQWQNMPQTIKHNPNRPFSKGRVVVKT